MRKEISRRQFLKGSAAGLAGAAAATAAAQMPVLAEEEMEAPAKTWRDAPDPVSDDQITASYEADVIVIGGGHSGTNAARAAAEAGATVILLEAMEEEFYSTFGNDFGHINSEYLAKQGVPKVDEIEFFNNWMLNTGNRANADLIMKFTKKCGAAFDWWIEPFSQEQIDSMNVDFWPETGNAMAVMNTGFKYWPGAAQLYGEGNGEPFNMTAAYKIFHAYIQAMDNAEIHYGTTAEQLIKEDGAVVGVIAQNADGEYVKYTANKGVLLAAGDFSGNQEMLYDLLKDQLDALEEGEALAGAGRNGSGIQMGIWAGGRLEPGPLPVLGDVDTSVPNNFAALWLDQYGKRYCNECFGDYVSTGYANVRHKHGTRYIVFDSTITEAVKYNVPAHAAFDPTDPSKMEDLEATLELAREAGAEGYTTPRGKQYFAADDVETLAEYLGLEDDVKENFLASIARYNENCAAGRDEDYGKDARLLFPVENGPIYCIVADTGRLGFMLVTNGGLCTDGNQQVLDMAREPIPGLFATGNCCGLRFGPAYFTPIAGVSLAMAVTMGREAGSYIASLA